MSDLAAPLPAGSKGHRPLAAAEASAPAEVTGGERRKASRRDADPPAWWAQMPAFWRVATQLGAIGVIFLAFWVLFQTQNRLLVSALDEQRRQAVEDRQLFRESMAGANRQNEAIAREVRSLTAEVRSLTNENRALTAEVRASRVRIEAVTPAPKGPPPEDEP